MKVYGDRIPIELMVKRLGAEKAAKLIPAIDITGHYGTRVWLLPDQDQLEYTRLADKTMAQVPVPGVVSFRFRRDKRIGASWVVRKLYEFANDSLVPLAQRPTSYDP